MQEIARVTLENEMDLILAHKRSMKLAELAGLSLSAQTTFATAVSEVSRTTIESGKSGSLVLCVQGDQREKYIIASLKDKQGNNVKPGSGFEYAKRLVNKYNVNTIGSETVVELFYYISPPFKLDLAKIDEWRSLFRNEPPISPYEEIKRKNEQLQELSEKITKSEAQYKTLTNSLPLIIFSLDQEGYLQYANEWLSRYTGLKMEALNKDKWQAVVYKDDYDKFSVLLKKDLAKGATTVKMQARLKNINGEYFWHQISLSPFNNEQGELQYWIGYIVDIHAQKVFEETLKDNIELKETQKELKENQQKLEKYVEELNRSNQELQQFAFVASHDLQEPIRKLMFYSDYLLSKYSGSIDGKAVEYLQSMQLSSQRMRNLIQDLLLFSQINKDEVRFQTIDLNQVVIDAQNDLSLVIEEKKAILNIQQFPAAIKGDNGMMRQLFENIIGNSLKYCKPTEAPVIDIGWRKTNDFLEISFKDNGIGFKEEYLPKMFTLFQRLHSQHQYRGTGLGLAICKKIVDVHQGKIWATGNEGVGATFFVLLPFSSISN